MALLSSAPSFAAGNYTLRVIARKSFADFETFSFDWKNATDTYFKYGACTFTGTSYVIHSVGGQRPVRHLVGRVLVRR